MMKPYNNPLILITLAKALTVNLPLANQNKEFDFKTSFGLQAGFEMRELSINLPRKVEQESNQWSYFYFYNPEPLQSVMVGLDSLNQGDADMFITRGKESRPTEYSHITRSEGYRSTFLTLDNSLIKARGFEDLKGFYVVGVKANTPIHYSIYWRRPDTILRYIGEDMQTTIDIPVGGRSTISYMNYLNDDLELILDTSHQAVKVFWDVKSTEVTYTGNDMELYPREGKNKLSWDVSIYEGIKILTVPKSTPGFCTVCRNLFTLQNKNNQEPISIQVKVSHRSSQFYFEMIQLGAELFGAGSKDEFKKYRIDTPMAFFANDTKGLGLEINLIYGTAKVQISKKIFQDSSNSETHVVRTGYTKLSLEKYSDGSVANGVLQPQKMLSAIVDIKCLESCSYKLQLVHPTIRSQLRFDRPREAFSAGGNQIDSFVLTISGKEPRVDVSLSIEELTTGNLGITDTQILAVLKVFHMNSKADLDSHAPMTVLLPQSTHPDGQNGRLTYEYKPVAGFMVIQIVGLHGIGFKYRLQVSTHWISSILPGRLTVNKLDNNATNHTYEMLHEEPGSIFAKLFRCYGDVFLEVKDSGSDNHFEPAYIDPLRYSKSTNG